MIDIHPSLRTTAYQRCGLGAVDLGSTNSSKVLGLQSSSIELRLSITNSTNLPPFKTLVIITLIDSKLIIAPKILYIKKIPKSLKPPLLSDPDL